MPDYEPLLHLPPVRRVVTGHDATGKAIFHRDELITPVAASSSHGRTGFTLIHRTKGFPVKNQGTDSELGVENLQRSKGPAGIVCEVVDIPPGKSGESPLLHRNRSLDYGVILDGTINLVLDDGAEQTLRMGDVFVQRYVTDAICDGRKYSDTSSRAQRDGARVEECERYNLPLPHCCRPCSGSRGGIDRGGVGGCEDAGPYRLT
jgi:hypothetical protein